LYVCDSNSDIALAGVPPSQVQPYKGGKNYTNVQFGKLTVYGGTFTAVDATTNKIIWQHQQGRADNCYSGSLATGGGLVFYGHTLGTFEADNAATGQKLWSAELDHGANASAATYTVAGKQYVAILAGGTSLGAFAGLTKAETAKEHGDTIYAFALP
jgi:glucose dehydrogenase